MPKEKSNAKKKAKVPGGVKKEQLSVAEAAHQYRLMQATELIRELQRQGLPIVEVEEGVFRYQTKKEAKK